MGRPTNAAPQFVIRPLPSGIFEIRWTERGRTKFKSTGTRIRAEAEAALKRHVIEYQKPKLPDDPLIADLIAAYTRDHLPTVASPASQRYALDKIAERLGSQRPAEMTDTVLNAYATWRKTQNRWGKTDMGGIGDGTVAREVNALRAVLAWASRNRLIREPIAIRLPVALPAGRERFLTRDEVSRILQACKPAKEGTYATEGTPHIDLFVRIALATAARKSAILELKWSQIGWPDSESPIRWRLDAEGEYEYQSLNHGMTIDLGRGVGNKRRAIVPVGDNAPLYHALKKAQKIAKTDFVIEFRGKPIEDVKSGLAAACDRAGVADCTSHVLKHTSVSWMVARGIPFGMISKITGTSTATLEKHYAHMSPGMASVLGDMFAV